MKLFYFIFLIFLFQSDTFKDQQLQYSKVKTAYTEYLKQVTWTLKCNKLQLDEIQIYLQVFKEENRIDLYAKNKTAKKFNYLKHFKICDWSGTIGPKRKQGDYQVPEGFYFIEALNPKSSYHLSMKINYPNPSDLILSDPVKPGGLIFIHGECGSVGCLAIENENIKELYVYAVEAMNNGQQSIPITIFPRKMNTANYEFLIDHADNPDKKALWTEQKKYYDYFNFFHEIPNVSYQFNGRHTFSK